MCHALKIFLKIIHKRIYNKLEEGISNSQFGFRNGFGTREALFAFNTLIQRNLEMNKAVFVCFVDYEKAFDKVQHGKMMEILRSKNIDRNDANIIENLYWNQTAKVAIEGEESEEIEIRRGVRQGCILSPLLFNMYSEEIFNNLSIHPEVGIKINGFTINNIRYADDAVIMANNINELNIIMNKLSTESNKYGLKINANKTKFIVFDKSRETQNYVLKINNVVVEKVDTIKYLGTVINSNANPSKEIQCRIEQARSAFCKIRKALTDREINLNLKLRFVKCYVWSVLLYGAETWL